MNKARLAAVAVLLALGIGSQAGTAFAGGALPNGFTAKIVAASGETISGSVDATGYDLGIYVGPGVHDVQVVGAEVTGANDEGILVQDASNVLIKDTAIRHNAISPYTGGTEVKGIVLTGTRNVLVIHNTVELNGQGGISVLDDGPNSAFAPTAIDSAPLAGTRNAVIGNVVRDNLDGCGIVVSAKNPGGGVYGNSISGNTVMGFDPSAGDDVPGVGGIVVAGGGAGAVKVMNTIVSNNTITGGFLPGISIHAYGPGVISGTRLVHNSLSHDGAGDVSKQTTGIEIFAVPNVGTISGTQILGDRVSSDYYGVYHVGDKGTHIAALMTADVTDGVGP